MRATDACGDIVVPAAGDFVTGLVADESAFSAPGSDADNQCKAWGGAAAGPCRAQLRVVAVPGARASEDAVVLAAGGADVVVHAAAGSVTGLVADISTFSAPGSDAQNQDATWGGVAARARRAQCLVVVVLVAGSIRDVGVQAAGATVDVAVQAAGASVDVVMHAAGAGEYVVVPAAGAGVEAIVQAAGASGDVIVPAARDTIAGLVSDDATSSACYADDDEQHDACGGVAAWA